MLRKRTRSVQKDQQHPQITSHFLTMPGHGHGPEGYHQTLSESQGNTESKRGSAFFSMPRLFVGFGPMGGGLSDCDSVRSPTSPLDVKLFSGLGSPYRSPRSPQPKSWDCGKVGLSIVDSLADDDDASVVPGKVIWPSCSKNICFGLPEKSMTLDFKPCTNSSETTKSLPRNFAIFPHTLNKSPLQKGSSDVIFEIEETTFDSERSGSTRSSSFHSCRQFSTLSRLGYQAEQCRSGIFNSSDESGQANPRKPSALASESLALTTMSVGSSNGFVGSLSASDLELSEDYTCITSHGPNPKTTHIYGDCILECRPNNTSDLGKNSKYVDTGLFETISSSLIQASCPSNDFLRFCHYCNKKLKEGEDIYIYRGEKSFCSLDCRSQEIMVDEILENDTNKPGEDLLENDNIDNLLESCIFDAP